MTGDETLTNTWSLCPICIKRIPSERVHRGREIFLRKSCPTHGSFETIIWKGFSDFTRWIGDMGEETDGNPNCPNECGLCSGHLQDTCCVILNVTDRCQLDCNFCFADSKGCNTDPDIVEIRDSLENFIKKDKTLVQLSGGEPTMRDDLPEIIKSARKAGAKYVQLNTNGLLLAADKRYVETLAEAGLSFVFMQFDGTCDEIYRRIRKKPLLEIKQRAIDNCAEFNIGVTLTPTLVKGINVQDIGNIVRYAVSQAPKVRGVHFQPVAFLGRAPHLPTDSERLTLDELVHEIEVQTKGMIDPENLLPSCCDHPLCGFHGDFVVFEGQFVPLLKRKDDIPACCGTAAAEKNREFVARRWKRPEVSEKHHQGENPDIRDMEVFLDQIKSHGFTLTAMAFQDAGNIDFARLRRCSLHVYDHGRMVPFCSYYMTPWTRL